MFCKHKSQGIFAPFKKGIFMPKAKKTKSKKYRARVSYYDNDGVRRFKSFTHENKAVAEQLAAEFKLMHKNSHQQTYDNLTLAEAMQRYIDSKSAVCSPSTIYNYLKIKRNNFKQIINLKIGKITTEMVQIAVDELAVDHSPKTVRNAYSLLHSTLNIYNKSLDLRDITLPAKQKIEINVPTTKEVNKLLEVADDYIRVPILLASQGSLRRSEICALTPDDFTDTGVNINKAVVYDKDGKTKLKSTKTYAGTRFVPLSRNVITECKQWQHYNLSPGALTDRFIRCRDKSGVSHFKFHALRHYFASELHAKGVPDKYICEVGGWETTSVLQNIYQHTMKDKKSEMSDKIVNIFNDNFNKCATNCANKFKKAD